MSVLSAWSSSPCSSFNESDAYLPHVQLSTSFPVLHHPPADGSEQSRLPDCDHPTARRAIHNHTGPAQSPVPPAPAVALRRGFRVPPNRISRTTTTTMALLMAALLSTLLPAARTQLHLRPPPPGAAGTVVYSCEQVC